MSQHPIKVTCFTTLDEYHKEMWPAYLYNPSIGDLVESHSGKILRIVQITHLYDAIDRPAGFCSIYEKAKLKVELHK